MLSIFALLILAESTGLPADCIQFEIWKGGDDGYTNRVFDQIDIYNGALIDCNRGRKCKNKDLYISSHVKVVRANQRELIIVPVEIYGDIKDAKSIERKFTVQCDLTQNNCAGKIFRELMQSAY